MATWKITLLLAAPASRTIPMKDKMHVFAAGKTLKGQSDELADRCRAINKAQGEIFEILPEQPAVTEVVPLQVACMPTPTKSEEDPKKIFPKTAKHGGLKPKFKKR